tara:strand:+ start:167 stop:1153 length:987 start_codon:yes stop_codon:yes gene_type:complete
MDNKIKYETLANFLKKNIKDFPECKIEEIKTFYKKSYKKEYRDVKSQRQISALVNLAESKNLPNILSRLVALLCARADLHYYKLVINKLVEKDYTDDKIYEFLRIFYQNNQKGGKKCNTKMIRAENSYYELSKIPNIKITNYLDVGCGDCMFTQYLGELLKIPYSQIYGRDSGTFNEVKYNNNRKHKINYDEIHYVEKGHPLKFKDNSMSLVSTMNVLHHVTDLKFFLQEIHRVTKKGGIYMVLEHDAFNYADAMLCDIEHMMYMQVYDNKVNKNVINNFYSKYRNWVEWCVIITSLGFKFIKKSFEFRSIDMEMQPTKHLMLYFQKI